MVDNITGNVVKEVRELFHGLNLNVPQSPQSSVIRHIPRLGESTGSHTGSTSESTLRFRNTTTTADGPRRLTEAGQLIADSFPPGLVIPKAPGSAEGFEICEWWIKDWEHADPSRGLNTALKDWKVEWYTGDVRTKFAQKLLGRRRLAEEFING
jgi:hypothetical protein